MSTKPKTDSQRALESLKAPRTASEPPPAPSADYGKISVSMFPADMAAADHLVGLMWEHAGVRATRSNALRLAVRFAADMITAEEVRERYKVIRQDDRRFRGKA